MSNIAEFSVREMGNMEQTTMDQTLGTKWFKFYTKVRPWLACFSALVVLFDFIEYTDTYLNHWWLLLHLAVAVACPVLGFMVAKRAKGDYKAFVGFVKKVLAFETVQLAYQQAITQYVETFDITIAVLVFGVILLLGYLLWYKLNVKYFEKRIPAPAAAEEAGIYSAQGYESHTQSAGGNPELPVKKKGIGKTVLIVIGIILGTFLLIGLLGDEEKSETPEPSQSQQDTATQENSGGQDKVKPDTQDSQQGSNTQTGMDEGIMSAEDIYTTLLPSVVEIYGESETMVSTGTGFFMDAKGTVVTNYHVIEGCQWAQITTEDGAVYDVVAVLGYDAQRDIAILSTNCLRSTPVSVRTTEVKTGETVYAIGSSLGLTGSLSDGLISAVGREVEGYEYIQTTAPISSGNSGGPLVDQKGQVVGIVCASFVDGQNLNLAIPIGDYNGIPKDQNVTLEELFPAGQWSEETASGVEWITNWFFQYYDEGECYVLLFGLEDIHEKPLTAEGTVEAWIMNDDEEMVYDEIHTFTPANFEEWIYDETEELYLATIYIPTESIQAGSTPFGTVYLEVYGEDFAFDICTEVVDCLPVANP